MPKISSLVALTSAVSLSLVASSAFAQFGGSVQIQTSGSASASASATSATSSATTQVVVGQPQQVGVGGVVVVNQPQPQRVGMGGVVVVNQPQPQQVGVGGVVAVQPRGYPQGNVQVDQFGRPINGAYGQPVAYPVTGPVGPQQTVNVQVPFPAQPQRPDQYVPPTQPGQVWVAGYWAWNNGQQQWIPGHWETPPQQGQVWMQPQYGRRGRGWTYRAGYWGQPQQIGNQYLQPGAFGIQAQVRPLQIGQLVTGQLDQTDYHRPQGGYADDYAVWLQAGQPVTFVVTGGQSNQTGQQLDVVASLHFQGQELASDDDGAGYPNARLVFTPRVSGVYALRVSSFGARFEMGSYSIQSWAGAVQNAQPFVPVQQWGWSGVQPQPQPQPQPVYVGPQPVQPQPIGGTVNVGINVGGNMGAGGVMGLNVNTQIQGALQQGDSVNSRGSFVDQYAINLMAGQPVTIVARGLGANTFGGGALDVMLDLQCNGQQVGHDDDSAGNRNARLVITPQQNAQCIVQVSSFGAARTAGNYQLVMVSGANASMQ